MLPDTKGKEALDEAASAFATRGDIRILHLPPYSALSPFAW